jgi:hypothetical protein
MTEPNTFDIHAVLAELAEVKAGYEKLDANWSALHNAGIDAFRKALEMPDASIPEMLSAIEHLRRPEDQKLHVFWDEEATYVVARTCEDAAIVYADSIGEEVTIDSLDWARFSDNQPLRIKCYGLGHPGSGTIAPADEEGPHIVLVTRPAIEWAHRQGRGFLCTTDY